MEELVFEKESLKQAHLAFCKDFPESSKIIDFLKTFEEKVIS